ncbi:MAG: GTPase HflX [Candidatus Electrothrix sp. GW3-4]|uniref:GTPase HflX n=1 Tax=Candidatus Electrothrix sp. GW3-4 TaxID=3126740 RepID=UPI0030D0860D
MTSLSTELNRQIGLIIHRSGKVEFVILGDYNRIEIPVLNKIRSAGGRLRGLRCVHTSFSDTGPNEEDIMDMACLRLDMISVLTMKDGYPDLLHTAHLIPEPRDERDWHLLEPVHPAAQQQSCLALIEGIEQEFSKTRPIRTVDKGHDRAILISVGTGSRAEAEDSMIELSELARAAGVQVVDRVIQRRRQLHPRFILGRGKLIDIVLMSLRNGANLLIFDQELSPSQVRSVTNNTDLRVIDRTQLILDIFASRARSREGKLQIEMAQLKYMLPMLTTKDDALSRLTGGIGARGPGETKLEIDRRRINDRIARLAKELKAVGKQRYHRRNRRRKHDVPVVSLVGYTNAGKSTLLNTLTHSHIQAEDMLFATLDPTSRRLRFPEDTEVIITDTVGFIRQLPAELLKAFESTLEELFEADLLLHIIDISNQAWKEQARVVEELLRKLELDKIPCLRVYNKIDLVRDNLPSQVKNGLCISAQESETLKELLGMMEHMLIDMSTAKK